MKTRIATFLICLLWFGSFANAENSRGCQAQVAYLRSVERSGGYKLCLDMSEDTMGRYLLGEEPVVADLKSEGFDKATIAGINTTQSLCNWKEFSGPKLRSAALPEGGQRFWQRFRKDHGACRGLISFSAPILNQTREVCIFYFHVDYGPLDGYGGFVQMRRVGEDKWKLEKRLIIGAS